MRARVLVAAATAALASTAIAVAAPIWPASQDRAAHSRVDRLSDRQLVGERIVVGFGGHDVPRHVRQKIHSGAVAGVILFTSNYSSTAGAKALIHKLQSIPRRRPLRHVPLLIMLDQEGGLVKRLPGPPAFSAQTMGHRSVRSCKRQGRKTGRYLLDVGVNADLAPVLDVARPGSAIGAQHRSFGRTAKRVTSHGGAFAAGLEQAGAAATGKHFPGLGAARQNTDFDVQRIHLSKRKLRHVDESPYRGPFGTGRRSMVMLSMAIYPAYDKRLPAALSHRIATRELRHHVGFRGVSISDALDTTSARAIGDAKRLAKLGARAGTDLLLYTSVGDAGQAKHALTAVLHSHHGSRAGFDRSARRVLKLRERLPG